MVRHRSRNTTGLTPLQQRDIRSNKQQARTRLLHAQINARQPVRGSPIQQRRIRQSRRTAQSQIVSSQRSIDLLNRTNFRNKSATARAFESVFALSRGTSSGLASARRRARGRTASTRTLLARSQQSNLAKARAKQDQPKGFSQLRDKTKLGTLFRKNQQGFRGDVGTVGVPRGILRPDSKFEIVGGKAVPKGAVSKTFGERLSSEDKSFGFSRVPTETSRGTKIPDDIRQIFGQERNVTLAVAQDFISKRNVALASGATIKEANALAKSQAIGLPRSEQEAVNTTLQKAIIERKAGQLALAEQLIKEQTTTGTTGQLDDLKGVLAKAEPIPATLINVSVDSEGKDINPRRTRVLFNNALLTGNKIEDLDIIFHQDPNLTVNDRGGFISMSSTGEADINISKLISSINPRSIDVILGGEQDVFSAVLKDIKLNRSGSEKLLEAQLGGTPLTRTDVGQLTTEGETLIALETFEGTATKLIAGEVEIIEVINNAGETIFNIIDIDTGEIIGTLTVDEFGDVLSAMTELINANEALSGENIELLKFIEELQELLRGGESTQDLLASLFSLIAELQAQSGARRPIEEEFIDPFAEISQFFENVYLGFLSLFGVKA